MNKIDFNFTPGGTIASVDVNGSGRFESEPMGTQAGALQSLYDRLSACSNTILAARVAVLTAMK